MVLKLCMDLNLYVSSVSDPVMSYFVYSSTLYHSKVMLSIESRKCKGDIIQVLYPVPSSV